MKKTKILKEVCKYPLGVGYLSKTPSIKNRNKFCRIIATPGIFVFKNGKRIIISLV